MKDSEKLEPRETHGEAGSVAEARRKRRAARISVISNTALILGKLTVGLVMSSVAIISTAVDSAIDLLAALIALYAVRQSARPPDRGHVYGHGKFEDLSGAIEAALILIGACFIVYEAVLRLIRGSEVAFPLLGLAVMGFSGLVDVVVSSYLFRVARQTESVALEADALHLSTDVWTSLGVMAAMGLIWATGWHWLDPVVAIAVAVLIIITAYRLTRKTVHGLVDAPLPAADEAAILAILREHKEIHIGWDSLRTRRAGPERHIDLHLHFPPSMPVQEAHAIAHHIQHDIEAALPRSQVLIHLEPCEGDCRSCEKEPCPDRTEPSEGLE
ncbi:MAG: cation diffusion facilitator family transporter [Candidatus Acetothermia bacterium]|nr:cation diffusion facilitator family transporter [Candidatus Acetothermia bacterium]MDH7506088.1 cation diffusion facilitator family transporter [Candidatus Acetothermia bacterium]